MRNLRSTLHARDGCIPRVVLQCMFQPPLIVATCFTVFSMRPVWHFSEVVVLTRDVRFSNRPFGVKHVQTFHSTVDVACGLVLLFGIGTKALPSWDSRTRQNNLCDGLIIARSHSSACHRELSFANG